MGHCGYQCERIHDPLEETRGCDYLSQKSRQTRETAASADFGWEGNRSQTKNTTIDRERLISLGSLMWLGYPTWSLTNLEIDTLIRKHLNAVLGEGRIRCALLTQLIVASGGSYSNVLIVQKHPKMMTAEDESFKVICDKSSLQTSQGSEIHSDSLYMERTAKEGEQVFADVQLVNKSKVIFATR
uniref:Uncharacterized protein n=1 Tax=Ascaris lumbricoides TaxID=6252 RepID=A0A9J2P609_ASCLU